MWDSFDRNDALCIKDPVSIDEMIKKASTRNLSVHNERYSPCKPSRKEFATMDKTDKRNAARYAKAEQIDREKHL